MKLYCLTPRTAYKLEIKKKKKMPKITLSDPQKEALKEVGRLVLFGAASGIVTELLSFVASFENQEVWMVAITLLLRYADKYLHEKSKKGGGVRGIAPF